jgi:hypothetical protein
VKLERILFGLVLAIWAVVLVAMLIPEPEHARGMVHPSFATMKHGGSGVERHAGVLWLGGAFGGLAIATFVTLMAFGSRRGDSLRGLGPRLVLGLAAYLGAWSWLVLAYRDYLTEPTHRLILGFPAPTAIMLYVLWPVSVVFNVLFVVGFKRWVFSDEDRERYERLVAEKRAGDGGAS